MEEATQPSLEGCDVRIHVGGKNSHLRTNTAWSAGLGTVCRLSRQVKNKNNKSFS